MPPTTITSAFIVDVEYLRERLRNAEARAVEAERALDEWRTAAIVAAAERDALAARLAEVT